MVKDCRIEIPDKMRKSKYASDISKIKIGSIIFVNGYGYKVHGFFLVTAVFDDHYEFANEYTICDHHFGKDTFLICP